MAMIEVKNLYKIFGPNPKRAIPLVEKNVSKADILKKTGCTVAINRATFTIESRETFVVMGLSGSGKSTFIRCLNRLIEPTEGEILIDNQDIMKMSAEELQELRRYKMSMVFQNFGLLPHRNVINNVEYGLEIGGMPKSQRREKAMKAVEIVGLKGFEMSMPSELSGGMQQRVGLARALANDPEILLMDEAFSALDPLIRTQMQDELIDLQAKMHKTIIFITHDLDEALKLGDRIVILGPDGRVRQVGTPEEILSEPADDYVEAFVRNVDRTRVITAGSIMRKVKTLSIPKEGPESALRSMEKSGQSILFVTDADRGLKGYVTLEDVVALKKQKKKDLTPILIDDVYTTGPETAVYDLLGTAMSTRLPIAVIDDEGRLRGIVERAAVIAEVNKNVDEEQTPTVLSEVNDEGDTANQSKEN